MIFIGTWRVMDCGFILYLKVVLHELKSVENFYGDLYKTNLGDIRFEIHLKFVFFFKYTS